MKFILPLIAAAFISISANAQFKDLVIVEIDNEGLVPGKTFQFYAQLSNNGDHVHIIFGDASNTLSIKSTEPFYQDDLAGPLSTNINPVIDSLDATVKYDSYFTIGRVNATDNKLSNFNMELDDFEKNGSDFITDDGAWYVTPDQEQAYCRNNNPFVLIMQLTSEGEITGNLNIQGKDKQQILWRELDRKFSSKDAISSKSFEKLKLKIAKEAEKEEKESKNSSNDSGLKEE